MDLNKNVIRHHYIIWAVVCWMEQQTISVIYEYDGRRRMACVDFT